MSDPVSDPAGVGEKPVSILVPDDLAGERADRIVAKLGNLSRAEARRLFERERVVCDGQAVGRRQRLPAGARIQFQPFAAVDILVPTEVAFEVVFEDDALIVVDKPPRLTVHPGAATRSPTLAAGLLHRYPDLRGVGEQDRWGIVHRLDRDTSGLMVVARTSDAHEALTSAIRKRAVDRRYVALVDGLFETPLGTIDAPIGTDPARPTRRIVRAGGRPARTHYERLSEWSEASATLLSVRLETGRTHQIRVHMASIGHPVIGDRVYGRPHRIQPPRVFLHATRLAFDHPLTGEWLEFQCPLPADLEAVLPNGAGVP